MHSWTFWNAAKYTKKQSVEILGRINKTLKKIKRTWLDMKRKALQEGNNWVWVLSKIIIKKKNPENDYWVQWSKRLKACVVEKDCKANRTLVIFNQKVNINHHNFLQPCLSLVNKYDYQFVVYRLDRGKQVK